MAEGAARGTRSELIALFIGILGPPTVWAARIAASYILVPYACATGWIIMMHLVTAAALLITGLIGWLAWDRWRKAGRSTEVDLGGTISRTRFMALTGLLSSALFFLVMVAEGLANFYVDPCQTAGMPLP